MCVDLFEVGIHQRDLIKSRHDLAHLLEGRVQRAERCIWSAGACILMAEDRQTVLVFGWRSRILPKRPSVPCFLCTLLDVHGQFVSLVPVNRIFRSAIIVSEMPCWHKITVIASDGSTAIAARRLPMGHAALISYAAGDIGHARAPLIGWAARFHGFMPGGRTG